MISTIYLFLVKALKLILSDVLVFLELILVLIYSKKNIDLEPTD